MAAKASGDTVKYGDVVQRLESVLRRLEGGDLSLEDSLKDYEEGIRLVRQGETLLNDAERRIEQLMADGNTIPLAATPSPASSAEPAKPRAVPAPAAAPPRSEEDDDVPF